MPGEVEEHIVKRFEELVELGSSLAKYAEIDRLHFERRRPQMPVSVPAGQIPPVRKPEPVIPALPELPLPFSTMQTQWFSSSRNLLLNVVGKNSHYYSEFWEHLDRDNIMPAVGVLIAVRDDYVAGFLTPIQTIVQAELFEDFLAQAEALLNSGYYGPAAVLAGCVLEDGLRKLCERQPDIHLGREPKLHFLNQELRRVGVIDNLTFNKILPLASLRNSAAHGVFSDFKPEDVTAMIPEIRLIMEKYFLK